MSASLHHRERPSWIRARAPQGPSFERVRGVVRELGLRTVCEQARCPNWGECWNRGAATFLILGDVCTRRCAFCAVNSGRPPAAPDPEEPERIAAAVDRMNLRHAVLTSVSRDDLDDGGAEAFATCIRTIRERAPASTVEVLVPDFRGDSAALARVTDARPDVLNHNLETVSRLYPTVRPAARFDRSLELLRRSKEAALVTKSGIMLGLGEEWDEVIATVQAIRHAGTDVLTIGQYLRPSAVHPPVERYYEPDEFRALAEFARRLGFPSVEAGPLVRSSYHAEQHLLRA